jgi:hypothetical protein
LPYRLYDVPSAGSRDQRWHSARPVDDPVVISDTHDQKHWHSDCPVRKTIGVVIIGDTRDQERWHSGYPSCGPIGVVNLSDTRSD